MHIICFDAEMADGVGHELLELSVFDGCFREIYHSYFKPRIAKQWKGSEKIHHISPEMVKDKRHFDECLIEVQAVVDIADCIVGFAVENDILALEYNGVKGLREKLVLDVRELYWAYKGQTSGMSLDSIPGLVACASALGVDFTEDTAHSASADTKATLQCFAAVCRLASIDPSQEASLTEMSEFCRLEKYEFRRRQAHGWVYLLKNGGGGYRLSFKKRDEFNNDSVVAKMEVNDRHKACYDLHNMFDKKISKKLDGALDLSAADIRRFNGYTNEYDEEMSSFCKSALRLRRLTLS